MCQCFVLAGRGGKEVHPIPQARTQVCKHASHTHFHTGGACHASQKRSAGYAPVTTEPRRGVVVGVTLLSALLGAVHAQYMCKSSPCLRSCIILTGFLLLYNTKYTLFIPLLSCWPIHCIGCSWLMSWHTHACPMLGAGSLPN